jgi:hypothetical protein
MTIVAACIGIVIVLLFLGSLAVLINSLPLTIIIVLGCVLIVADFVGSLRRADKEV